MPTSDSMPPVGTSSSPMINRVIQESKNCATPKTSVGDALANLATKQEVHIPGK